MRANNLFYQRSQGRMVIIGCIVASVLLLTSLIMAWGADASPQENIVLIFTYSGDDSSSVAAAAEDFADLLSQETGLTIQASVQDCEAQVLNFLAAGQADLATIRSYTYVHGHAAHGIQARLVNSLFGQPYYKSQIMVQSSSGYTDISDLSGKRFASSHPNSASGYYIPYLMVLDATMDTPEDYFSEVYFTESHSQTVRDVYTGAADCGASYVDARTTVVGEYPDVNSVVSVIQVSEEIPNDPWVFRAGLGETLKQSLTDGIIAVAGTTQGEAALQTIFSSSFSGIEPVQDSDYDIIRDLVAEFGIQVEPCNPIYLPTIINLSGK